jgi:hypothetical protein
MLHPPIYDTKAKAYCGPTAISAVGNVPISKIHKMIRRVRSDYERGYRGRVLNGGMVKDIRGYKKRIVGVSNSELLQVMKRLGFKSKPHAGGMTLRQFCEDRGHMGPFIVNVTGHYIAVSHGMVCDTCTKSVARWQDYPRLRWRVKRFWLFT